MKKKVALGLSGGVDSALSAHLLVEEGYDVTAVYIECWHEPGCRAEQDRKDALQVALNLNIPFQVLDYKKTYKEKVMQYFLDEYQAGRTPNPDVMCNKIIKFGLFYDWAIKEQDFDFVATGHYAQIIEKNGKKFLAAGRDTKKDQTYFLNQIEKTQLDHILFPIGKLRKNTVRNEAEKRNILVAQKKDSVGICFVGDINVRNFIKENLGEKRGEVVDEYGTVIGSHTGLWFYTIGQRQGFTIDTKALIKKTNLVKNRQEPPPLYVIGKDIQNNFLIVGAKKKVSRSEFLVRNIHWIHSEQRIPDTLLVRIRHTGDLISCTLKKIDHAWKVSLQQPVDGVASGQSAVFYEKLGEEFVCLGGGVIEESI